MRAVWIVLVISSLFLILLFITQVVAPTNTISTIEDVLEDVVIPLTGDDAPALSAGGGGGGGGGSSSPIEELMGMMGMGGELYITIGFPPSALSNTVNQKLNSNDYVASFQTNTLDRFPLLNTILLEKSFEDVQSAIPIALANGYNVIGYDAEKAFIPADELDKIHVIVSDSCNLIHDAGLKCMVGSSRPTLKTFWDKVDWTEVDIFLLPLQKVAGTPDYQILGERYGGHAKAMNPNIKIFSNINLEFVSIDTAVSEITQLRDKGIIDGVSIISLRISDSDLISLLTALGR